MSSKIRIGIIGAGETGATLLKNFMKFNFIEIVMVADVNENAPGIKIAREKGIPVTGDFTDIINLGNGVDIIADAVGKKEIRVASRYHLKEAKNDHAVIVPEIVNLLIDAMVNNRADVHKSKHGYQVY